MGEGRGRKEEGGKEGVMALGVFGWLRPCWLAGAVGRMGSGRQLAGHVALLVSWRMCVGMCVGQAAWIAWMRIAPMRTAGAPAPAGNLD